MHRLLTFGCLLLLLTQPLIVPEGKWLPAAQAQTASGESPRKVKGYMQPRPGARMKQIEADIHEAPTNPPFVKADQIRLPPQDLVLGLLVDSQAWALPVRFLARFEIINSRLGQLPVAGTW